MRRAALGLIALALLAGGLAALYAMGKTTGDKQAAASAAIRAGVLLGAIWLALPQLAMLAQRFPAWMMVGVVVVLLTLVVRPRLLAYVVPLLLLLALLQFVSRIFRAPPPGTGSHQP